MADAKSVDITVSKFVDNTRLSGDAFSRATSCAAVLQGAAHQHPGAGGTAVVSTDGKTRISGVLERLEGNKWVPLRKGKGGCAVAARTW